MTTDPGERTCAPGCTEHREHVYVLCYGYPVRVADRDYLPGEPYDRPISHYVGHTTQQPPVKRIRSHANRSAHHIADLRPGTVVDEKHTKLTGRCPTCGASLWYYHAPRPRKARR